MGEFASIVPVITIGSFSKRWIIPGWRIGWIAICDPQGILQESGVCFLFITFLCLKNYGSKIVV